jgi:hypothetical protein
MKIRASDSSKVVRANLTVIHSSDILLPPHNKQHRFARIPSGLSGPSVGYRAPHYCTVDLYSWLPALGSGLKHRQKIWHWLQQVLPFEALISRESCLHSVHAAIRNWTPFLKVSRLNTVVLMTDSINKMCNSVCGMLLTGENWRTGEDTFVSVTLSRVTGFPTDIIKTNETHPSLFSACFPNTLVLTHQHTNSFIMLCYFGISSILFFQCPIAILLENLYKAILFTNI